MADIEKLLKNSAKRKEEISDLIALHFPDSDGNEKLLEAAKEMDNLRLKVKKEQAALERCSVGLAQTQRRWEVNVNELFLEEMKIPFKEKTKEKSEFFKNLDSHINKRKDDDDLVMVSKEDAQAIDPWTRQPIKNPVRAPVCNHLYDKRSINCLIRKRPDFKCPYVGCQAVVVIKDLIDIDE